MIERATKWLTIYKRIYRRTVYSLGGTDEISSLLKDDFFFLNFHYFELSHLMFFRLHLKTGRCYSGKHIVTCLVVMTKYLTEWLNERRAYLAHSSRLYSIMVGKRWLQIEVTQLLFSVRKLGVMDAGVLFPFSFLFTPGLPSRESQTVPLTVKANFPTSFNVL